MTCGYARKTLKRKENIRSCRTVLCCAKVIPALALSVRIGLRPIARIMQKAKPTWRWAFFETSSLTRTLETVREDRRTLAHS